MTSKYFLDVGCGFIPGRSIVNVFGNVFDVKFTDVPCTVWGPKILHEFPNVGEVWQVRSTSPLDTLLGLGAQRVILETLDDNYNQVPIIIDLAGTTPVVLPTGATNFRLNAMTAFQADPNGTRSNVGDIILEPIGGGPLRATILAGKGTSTAFLYTVPANHVLWVPNFLFNMAKLGGGNAAWKEEFRVLLPNGTSIAATTASTIQGSVPIIVPSGFVIPEKTSIEVRIIKVSENGVDINVQSTGILTDLTNPAVIQRRPTAWTEY